MKATRKNKRMKLNADDLAQHNHETADSENLIKFYSNSPF